MTTAHNTSSKRDDALFDAWTRDYALLGLHLDRLAPGTVDAWIGPSTWRDAVQAEPLPSAEALRRDAEALLERLPAMGYEQSRAAYLTRQVTALHTLTRLLGGETMRLAEQAALFFDVQPERMPESGFEAAQAEMAAILPGTGSLVERWRAWRRGFEVAPERVLPLLDGIVDELRARTTRHVPLPRGEGIELALVRDQPWGAYNWYLGNARSRVEINTDLPLKAHTLVDYLAHEGYPGHHAEHALREARQYRASGQGEYAIQLINTPESLISEAIATSARGVVFDDDEDLAWTAAQVLPSLGLEMDPALAARLRAAGEALSWVDGNAAFLLHDDGRPADEVAAYLERWSLVTPAEARKRLEFLGSPLWRSYVFTYSYGHALLKPLLDRPDKWAVFERILSEPVYPSLLASWSGAPS